METLERYFNARVAAFLDRTGMSTTTFGMRAVGDPNLLRQIAAGRSLSVRMANRILAFIDGYDADSDGARAPPRDGGTGAQEQRRDEREGVWR